MRRKHAKIWTRLAAGVLAVALAAGVGVSNASAASAAGSAPIIDGYVTVNAVTVNSDRSVSVTYTKKKAVPSQAGLKVAWYLPKATRDSAAHQAKAVSGGKGKVTVKFTGVPQKIMPVRVAFTLNLPQNNEERNFYRLVAPGSHTNTITVNKKLLTANVIASQVPGVALSFIPQTRIIKIVGYAAMGWGIYSAFADAFDLNKKGCPAMKVGQVIQQTSSTSLSGATVKANLNTKIWTNATAKKQGKKPLCNATVTLASYS